MAVNQDYNVKEPGDESMQLPLYDFFISLKQHGFMVTPAQIADSHAVIAQYAGSVENEAGLCDYLSPLFANNEDEQVKFRELFNASFKIPVTEVAPAGAGKQKLSKRLAKHGWKYFLGIAAIAAGIFITNRDNKVEKKDTIFLHTNYKGDDRLFYDDKFITTKDTLAVNPQTNDQYRDSIYQINLISEYDWGDGSRLDSGSAHRYTKKGIYPLTAFVKVFYGRKFQYADTLRATIKVCDEFNSLVVDNALGSDSVRVAEKVRLIATVTGRKPDSIQWYKGNQWLGNGQVLDTLFSSEGYEVLTCIAIYDSLGSPCNLQRNVSLVLYDPEKPVINASIIKAANANRVNLKRKVQPRWFFFTGALFLLSFTGMIVFEKWNRKTKRKITRQQEEAEKEYHDLVTAFAGKKPPFDLPFRSKNNLVPAEPALNEVAWQMRRRIDEEATWLHLQKTIRRSIQSAGFFQPVKVPRTHQSEWLVLIDETNSNNLQVRLFEYLAELMRKQNVFIDQYYYRKEPAICYNVMEPAGITLEKLHEKFPRHILLIFGNAYQFIFKYYPVFDHAYLPEIRRWKYKAIITPVTVPDWGNKEKNVLAEEIPVFPVDVFGQLLLVQKLFSGEEINAADFNEFRDQLYKTASVDFEETEAIEQYCENASWARMPGNDPSANILFQWIAALALYPRIRWEIILAIGKAIVEKYGKPEELNFTTLLRIARIKWMSEGRFPDYTRLELLKKLQVGNEVAARETILALLNEIPGHEINSDHFVYEEKEIQRIINEFNLYAHDPVKYAAYEGSRAIFERLWKEQKMLDAPAKLYLKNEEKQWRTLINKEVDKNAAGSRSENIPVEEYFHQPPEDTSKIKNLKLWVGFVVSVLFLGSLVGLVFLTILNFLNTNRFEKFTYKKPLWQKVSFTYRDSSKAKVVNDAYLSIDTTEMKLVRDSVVSRLLRIDDTLKNISLSVNGEQVLSSSMVIDQDAYIVSLNAAPVNNQLKATLYLSNACTAAIYDYKRNISEADPGIVINDSLINLPAVKESVPCVNRVSFGSGIDTLLIQRIIGNFRNSGVELTIAPVNLFSVISPVVIGQNEITIYYVKPGTTTIPVEQKPVIYIQLSDESLRSSANAFQKALVSRGHRVGSVSVVNNNYNSQISYYSANTRQQAIAIQQLYRSYYPDLPIPAKLVDNTRLAGNEGIISIFIKKLDDGNSLPLRQGASGPKVVELQELLIDAGFKYVVQNSVFDETTERAVKDFQARNKLAADGIVGPQVWALLNEKLDPDIANQYPNQKQPPQQQQQQQLQQFKIGDRYGGGIVFYVDNTGQHGLIAAPSDQSKAAFWGCYGVAIPGADGEGVGTGKQNTIDILSGCSEAGIAARLCSELSIGGFSDWYLPSYVELKRLWENKDIIGEFSKGTYWSSTESEGEYNRVSILFFETGTGSTDNKRGRFCVRAIRAF